MVHEFSDKCLKYTFDFDMQILRIGKRVYVNFKEFSYATETGSRQIKFANIDKWIEMPYEIVQDLIDVDAQNREVLNSFGIKPL